MWKSFSKGLDKNWKAATKGISKAADKSFEKVAHGTYDRSDHWHSEYPDEGFVYDLKLRRDKVAREKDGPAQTGKYKFTWDKNNDGEKHSSEGSVEYAPGLLTLRPAWWLHEMNLGKSDELQIKFQTTETVEEPKTGNGCYLVPPGFMDVTLTRNEPGENGLPVFEVECRPPSTGKNTRTLEKTAVRGSTWKFEIYLPIKSEEGNNKEEGGNDNDNKNNGGNDDDNEKNHD